MSIKENVVEIKNIINDSCKKVGRDTSEVTLVAVSKTKPVEDIMEAYNAGMRIFGENYVQEIVEKFDKVPSDVEFHMIGHLQRNKIKYIIDKVKMIHSVDSIRLAQAISKEAVKKDVIMPILLEVNMAKEESKWGFMAEEMIDVVTEISKLPNITIEGLMTSAPIVNDSEFNRDVFKNMKELAVDIKSKNIDNVNMNVLSMGMSGDYKVAVQEGATHVRVGTNIFGKRNYNL